MRCRSCLFDPCACGSEDYPTEEEQWFTIVCLGTEPLAFGPFQSEVAAKGWLDGTHAHQTRDEDDLCYNGIEHDDHHTLALK